MADLLPWIFGYGIALWFVLAFLRGCHSCDQEPINHSEEKDIN